MNSKFLRFLLIINGILLPAFLIYVFGIIYLERKENKMEDDAIGWKIKQQEEAQNKLQEARFRNSGPFNIPTTPFYYLTVEMETQEDQFYEEEIPIDFKIRSNGVRGKTVNLIFLDEQQNQLKSLLPQNGLIVYMSIANEDEELSGIEKVNHIAYVIATSDTNGDGEINGKDG